MMTQETVKNYWNQFLDSLPDDSPYRTKTYVAEGWGDSPALADELGALIVQGMKTATCSALWEWEASGETIPQPGLITIALDGHGEPLCIVETIEITIRNYNEVDADFARAEGEGDLSLEYWRKAHRNYFSRVLPKVGREFSEDMPLVCERFRVIYK
ncbi:MAG TPA: ASCH domain-containing protein [Anaerolineales bacterium]|nr:ASCH domain-containing protein [Anaerolineales bacterium]